MTSAEISYGKEIKGLADVDRLIGMIGQAGGGSSLEVHVLLQQSSTIQLRANELAGNVTLLHSHADEMLPMASAQWFGGQLKNASVHFIELTDNSHVGSLLLLNDDMLSAIQSLGSLPCSS